MLFSKSTIIPLGFVRKHAVIPLGFIKRCLVAPVNTLTFLFLTVNSFETFGGHRRLCDATQPPPRVPTGGCLTSRSYAVTPLAGACGKGRSIAVGTPSYASVYQRIANADFSLLG